MKEIPLLKAADIEARVQSVFSGRKGTSALLLLYKSARTDMRILDEVFGPTNWKRSHEVINGAMFCTISIYDEDKKEWVSKQDVGVPSNRDSRKGEASDAFKRAGFNWGIGRELYDAPTVFVKLNPDEVDTSKGKPQLKSWVRFMVADAEYDKELHEFTRLVIVDKNGQPRFQMGRGTNTPKAPPKPSNGNMGHPGTNDEARQKVMEAVLEKLTNAGVDPDQISTFGFKMPFNSLTNDQLSVLLNNFDACVNQFRSKSA